MKKLGLLILMIVMLCGCSQGGFQSTYMITRDNQLYALYDQDGEKLTDYKYKTFQEVDEIGYIVTNAKDEKGFVDTKGKETIPFGTYQTLEAVDQMLYATKKVDKPTPTTDIINNNLYVLNSQGKVLASASQEKGIRKSKLPILVEKNKYTVLYKDGETLFEGPEEVISADQVQNSLCAIVNFTDHTRFYDFYDNEDEASIIELKEQGHFEIMAVDQTLNESLVIYDKAAQSMVCLDRVNKRVYQNHIQVDQVEYDESHNIIIKQGSSVYVYEMGKKPVLMTSYYMSGKNYVNRSDVIYGPHQLYKDGKKTGNIENYQLYPAPYLIRTDVFPVYARKKGFVYYNFANEQVINDVYLEAEPFDINKRAIVKKDQKGYSLIDETGTIVTDKAYTQIKYIGSSYYVAYNKDGRFGIIDTSGEEVLPMEYTTLPKQAFINWNNEEYILLGKNGRSHLYDAKDDMKEVLSIEGTLVFEEKGYFSMGNVYYTFDGELIQ